MTDLGIVLLALKRMFLLWRHGPWRSRWGRCSICGARSPISSFIPLRVKFRGRRVAGSESNIRKPLMCGHSLMDHMINSTIEVSTNARESMAQLTRPWLRN